VSRFVEFQANYPTLHSPPSRLKWECVYHTSRGDLASVKDAQTQPGAMLEGLRSF